MKITQITHFEILDYPEIPSTTPAKTSDERRNRLAIILKQQIALAANPKKSGKADGCWFGPNPVKKGGGWWVAIYYGTKSLRRVQVKDRAEVSVCLSKYLVAVEGKFFDEQIEEVRAA